MKVINTYIVEYKESYAQGELAAACDDICWDMTQAKDYSLRNDMVYPSGILHYWSNSFKFKVGASLSSTDVALINKL